MLLGKERIPCVPEFVQAAIARLPPHNQCKSLVSAIPLRPVVGGPNNIPATTHGFPGRWRFGDDNVMQRRPLPS